MATKDLLRAQRAIYELAFTSVKTSLHEKPFVWKCVPPTCSFSCKLNSFSHEWFYTQTRFETKAQGKLEMVHL